MPEIGVARAHGAEDDSVVATRMVRAGGSCVDGHDGTRQSRLGAGTMMDAVGDSEEAWCNAMAQVEKVDRLMEGRKKMRRYINVGDP